MMKKRPAQRRLFHVLTLSLAIMLVGGGVALLYQWHQGATSGYASSDSVVGKPSLPASYVDAIFRQLGSPMVGTGKAVEAASRAQNIDDAFALGVWWTETNDGAAGVGLADLNPGSVRGSIGYPSAYDGYTIYPSYTAAVNYWFKMLKVVYIDRGLTTVSTISHPYVGTSTSDLWAGKVINLMDRYRAEAPPPVTPTPTIALNLKRQAKQLSREQQQQGQNKSTYYPPVAQTVQNSSTTGTGTTTTIGARGLSGNTQNMLVLFGLLLALVLGLWAWSVNKRNTRRLQPALESQATLSPWEKMRATGQQPASFFNGFSTSLRTTDSLVPGLLPDRSTAETLVPGLRSTSDLSAGWRTTGGLGATPAAWATFASSAQPAYPVSAQSAFALQESPFAQKVSMTGRPVFQSAQASPPPSFPTWSGQQYSPAFSVPTTDYAQTTSAHSPLRRTRLQPAGASSPQQPQPASISTSGGGLLSRYRDAQARQEQGN
jgi:hypothetical protein